ncbi:MAG TPA: NADH-quinone oxidoreductase subunit J [Armatimonadota bacterium]|jgi:NADH:ubiquinone oxidoreductase subunit 6 (subunit J)
MTFTSHDIAFVGLALLTLAPAALVVTLRNLIHAALLLGCSFVGVAGLYLLLNAEFIAAAQVLVYVGAITVLILFAIMLTQKLADNRFAGAAYNQLGWGLFVAAMVFLSLGKLIASQTWPAMYDAAPVADTTRVLGVQLLTTYIVPFEVSSVLLLVALVAAIVLARDEEPVSVPAHLNEIYDDESADQTPTGGANA